MNVICSGITINPTRSMNRNLRPENFIQANPYAANDAMNVEMAVAGTLINRLLRNDRPRPSLKMTPT
jgi:hypothetical protein